MKFIFLDRDGTIVVDEIYNNYRSVIILPETIPALLMLRDAGFKFAVITNQSGIARGIVEESNVIAQNKYLELALAERGIVIEGFSYCPHLTEDNCSCRKPLPNMLFNYKADFRNSWMLGDKQSDVECGLNAGCRALLVEGNLLQIAKTIKDSLNNG